METALRIIAADVDDLLSLDDKICMTLANKCFLSTHEYSTYHDWNYLIEKPLELDTKFKALLKRKPKLDCLDILVTMIIDENQIYEIYNFIYKNSSEKLEIALNLGNNTKTFCKFLRDYDDKIKKDIIKKYFRLVIDHDDIELFKELVDTLITTKQTIRFLRFVGNQSRLNIISEKLEFINYIDEIQIYDMPYPIQINQDLINALDNIPKILFRNFDVLLPSLFLAKATTIHDTIIRNEIDLTVNFFVSLNICKRLEHLTLCNLHSTQILKKPMIIDLLISSLPKNLTIEFRENSILDPNIIFIIKILAEKRQDIKIELFVYRDHRENLCIFLIDKQLKCILNTKNYNIVGIKHRLFNYNNLTYKDLLKQLKEADIYLYMMWSQLQYPK